MNVTFPETSCAVMGDASQDRGSVMGFQTALMIAMRRNAQKQNLNVAPHFSPVQMEFTASLVASVAMVLRIVPTAVMKKTAQQIPYFARLPDSTVGMACALIKVLCVTTKTTVKTTVMRRTVKAIKKLAVTRIM